MSPLQTYRPKSLITPAVDRSSCLAAVAPLDSARDSGSLLLFANGYAICHGPASNRFEARRRLRRYARRVQKAGYPDLRLTATGLVTLSQVASVGRRLNLPDVLALVTGASYEPELNNYLMLRTPRAHFNVFSTGKVVVTGLRSVILRRNDPRSPSTEI